MSSSLSGPSKGDTTPVSLQVDESARHTSLTAKDFGFLPIPKRLRYDPDKSFHFGLFLNLAFGVATAFTAANLYYCQPILSAFMGY